MPATRSVGLTAHMNSGSTTMCMCVLIVRRDGEQLAFTNHDRDLVITLPSAYVTIGAPSGAITYKAADSFEPSAIENTSDFSVQTLESNGYFDVDAVTEDDLRSGKYDGAEVYVFEVNWADLTQGIFPRKWGHIGETTPMDYSWKMEIRGPMNKYTQQIGSQYTPECPFNVGSDLPIIRDCHLDMTDFTETATVVSVNADGSIVVSGLTHFEPDWYQLGVMTGVSSPPGVLSGLSQEIKAYDPETGTLYPWLPFDLNPEVGDQFTVTAGCDKRFETCKLKFNNTLNFGGFIHIPGQDVIQQTYVPPAAEQTTG